jgi:hypothetical protein
MQFLESDNSCKNWNDAKRWCSKCSRRTKNILQSLSSNRTYRRSVDYFTKDLVRQMKETVFVGNENQIYRHLDILDFTKDLLRRMKEMVFVGNANSCEKWIYALENYESCNAGLKMGQKTGRDKWLRKWLRSVSRSPAPKEPRITANLNPRTQTLTPAFMPTCIRQPNRLATELLQMIAFAPIFLSHATRFAELHVNHRLCYVDKFDGSLTHQPSIFTHRFNLAARARSSVQLSWSNVVKTQSRKQPVTPFFTWKNLEIGGLGPKFEIVKNEGWGLRKMCMKKCIQDCGRCKPYCAHDGSWYDHFKTQMKQLWCSSSLLSTKMAIELRIPCLWRPSKGCAAAMHAHLAVAMTCCRRQPGFNVRAAKRMSCCILMRVFNVRAGLQKMAQVTRLHFSMTCMLALHQTLYQNVLNWFGRHHRRLHTPHESSYINLGAQFLFPPVKRRQLPLRIFLRILDYKPCALS